MRLSRFVERWKQEYVMAAFGSLIVGTAFNYAKTAREADEARARQAELEARPEKETGLEIRFDELRVLDPEASPERIRLLLDTLPEGYVEGDISAIGFTDEVLPMPEAYGEKLSEGEAAAHAAGGMGDAQTAVIFWRGMKDSSSKGIWNGTFLHEVGHCNDWERDGDLDAFERADLKMKVIARVLAPDRFKSDYVESISSSDKQKEVELKAVEYWAEINEAHLNGILAPFSPDADIVREHIARTDPDFNRDEALAARKLILAEMADEEASKEFTKLPRDDQDAIRSQLDRRVRIEAEPKPPAVQREGRKELMAAMLKWGATREGKEYLAALTDYHAALQSAFEARVFRKEDKVMRGFEMGTAAHNHDSLIEAAEKYPEADFVRQEFERLIDEYGLWVSGSERRVVLGSGELDALTKGNKENLWAFFALGWDIPSYDDPVDEYLARNVFTMPE